VSIFQPNWGQAAIDTANAGTRATNLQTTANRPTQINPWGQMNWTPGADGTWTQNVSLSPGLQDTFDAQNNLARERLQLALGNMGGLNLDQPLDLSGLPEVGSGQASADAVYGRMSSRLDPQWDARAQQLEITLRNRGLTPMDEAWNAEMDSFSRARNDAYNQANLSAVGAGQNEMRLARQLRDSALNETLLTRLNPLQEINALTAGQTIDGLDFDNFNQASRSPYADMFDAALRQYSSGLDEFSVDQAGDQRWLDVASDLGQAGLGVWGDDISDWLFGGNSGDGVFGSGASDGGGDGGVFSGVGDVLSGAGDKLYDVGSSIYDGIFGGGGGGAVTNAATGPLAGVAESSILGGTAADAAGILGAEAGLINSPAMGGPGFSIAGDAGVVGQALPTGAAGAALGFALPAGAAALAFSNKASARNKRQDMWDQTRKNINSLPRNADGSVTANLGGKRYSVMPGTEPFGFGTFRLANGGVLAIGNNPGDVKVYDTYEDARKVFRATEGEKQARQVSSSLGTDLSEEDILNALGARSGGRTARQQHIYEVLNHDESP
jgi:hypothetical protein